MSGYVVKGGKRLRCGITTGTCGAAAAKAATVALFSENVPEEVYVKLPSGDSLAVKIDGASRRRESYKCAVVKFAGDDPDITDGIRIWAEVSKEGDDILIDGGAGVGRVTKAGLKRAIGEPSINPEPEKMIYSAVYETCEFYGYEKGLKVIISAEKGEELSAKTFNPRLGIIGGISILGTTGIVEPMSEKAIVETIFLEIDAKAALGGETLLMCPGNYGRDFVYKKLLLDFNKGIKCSNYIGEALDYASYKGFKEILIVGHAGKLCKLAGGVMNTHSSIADCRSEIFTAHSALAGVPLEIIEEIMAAATTDEIDFILEKSGKSSAIWQSLMNKIYFYINNRLKGSGRAEAIVFTNKTGKMYFTSGAAAFVHKLKESVS